MKDKNKKSILLISIISFLYFFLFLACATLTEDVAISTINIRTLNKWLKGHEEKIQVKNILTPKELMEVTRLCIQEGELKNIHIIEENDILSFAVLEGKIEISKHTLRYIFTYSISKSGVLTLKIKHIIEEQEEDFRVNVYDSDIKEYKERVIQTFSDKLKENIEIVIKRSYDFV